jgi:NAD(P)-dependent dehydrogenase (short-subunit alcohol dehydrogenase family)
VNSPLLLVLGAGPGLGLSVARRFGREGYAVALAGQTAADMQPLVATLAAEGITASALGVDLTDPSAVDELVGSVGEEAGRIDVLHFNPSAFRMADPLHLTVDELFEDLRLGVAPLLPAVQAARPFMSEGARVLVTGSAAADKPWHEACSLGVQKAAVRNLVTSLDATLAPDGIRAVAVQVNGVLDKEGPFAPPAVAEALYAATVRPNEGWTPHVPYNG